MQTVSYLGGFDTIEKAREYAKEKRGHGRTATISKGADGKYVVIVKKPGKPNFG